MNVTYFSDFGSAYRQGGEETAPLRAFRAKGLEFNFSGARTPRQEVERMNRVVTSKRITDLPSEMDELLEFHALISRAGSALISFFYPIFGGQ